MGAPLLALFERLPRHHRGTDHDIAQERHLQPGRHLERERQYVGRAFLATVGLVEFGTLVRVHHPHHHLRPLAPPGENSRHPAPETLRRRHPTPGQGVLHRHAHAHRFCAAAPPFSPYVSYAVTIRCTSGWRTTSRALKKVKLM